MNPLALLTLPFRFCAALESLAVEIRELRLLIEARLAAEREALEAQPTRTRTKAVKAAKPEQPAEPEPELDLMLPGMAG